MVKVHVSGMVWLQKDIFDSSIFDYFRNKLLIIPKKFGNYGDKEAQPTAIKCWSETENEFGVPRAFWFNNVKKEYEYRWDISTGRKIDLDTKIRCEGCYSEQAGIIDGLTEYFSFDIKRKEYGDKIAGISLGGIFQAGTGFGKTVTALEFIRRKGVSALVLVHKEFLLNQWIERSQTWLPGANIGIVQGKKCDFEDKDIVIGMVESIALEDGNRYPREFYNYFGIVVVDEVHRISAPTWSSIPEKFSSMYRLGLSATPKRKDRSDGVFWWHIGEVTCKAETKMPEPSIRMIRVPKPLNNPPILTRAEANDSVVVTTLSKVTSRNWRITVETIKALSGVAKRKIMILSERLDHLRKLEEQLMLQVRINPKLSKENITTGFYVGEWFTGEVIPKLDSHNWDMENGGRERAIHTIYMSISRRKEYRGLIKSRESRSLPNCMEKIHCVFLPDEQVSRLFGFNYNSSDDGIILEDSRDDILFSLASMLNIQQKKKEKLRFTTLEEQREAARARVIYATFQMVSEGVDIPAIDTIGFATPVSDVEQAIGRGRRFCVPDSSNPNRCEYFCPWKAGECQGKSNLVVFDIVDIGYPLCAKRERWRKEWYWDNGFKVVIGE